MLQGSTLIRNASVTECSFTPSMIDVSQTYTLQGGDLPCKGAKVVVKVRQREPAASVLRGVNLCARTLVRFCATSRA